MQNPFLTLTTTWENSSKFIEPIWAYLKLLWALSSWVNTWARTNHLQLPEVNTTSTNPTTLPIDHHWGNRPFDPCLRLDNNQFPQRGSVSGKPIPNWLNGFRLGHIFNNPDWNRRQTRSMTVCHLQTADYLRVLCHFESVNQCMWLYGQLPWLHSGHVDLVNLVQSLWMAVEFYHVLFLGPRLPVSKGLITTGNEFCPAAVYAASSKHLHINALSSSWLNCDSSTCIPSRQQVQE